MKPYVFQDDIPAIDILDPSLPQPWIHYLSNGQMHAFVSQAGGGFSWWRDPVECRLSRYRMFHLPADRPGFYLYVAEEGKETFCPTYQPVGGKVDDYCCSFRPGKAVYSCGKGGIKARQEQYITPDENLLVWDVTVENTTDMPRTLDLTAYVEVAQLKWVTEQLYGYYWRHMLKTWRGENDLLCYLYQFREGTDYINAPLVFFGSSGQMHSFSTDRNAFMGSYRDESNPKAVENHGCGNETMFSGEPCFALQVRRTLAPGETARLSWFMGVAEDGLVDYDRAVENAGRMAALGRSLAWLDGQKQKLADTWANYLDKTCCVLPDRDLQRMISTWAPINCMTTARYSRAINVEAPGVRGYGFRDTTQDMVAMCAREPELAKKMFKRLLSKQYAAGKAVHMFPLNPSELPQFETRCDSHLWLPMLLYGILADTGEYGLLEEKVPYLSEDHLTPQGEGTVWEHMMAAMDFTEANLGAHGLPLTLKGDWNDIIGKFSQHKKGESVFAAAQYVIDLKLLTEIAQQRDLPEAQLLLDRAAKQRAAMEAHAFNGKWWYRCFDDNGEPIGDENSEFGKLWLNPQSWAVMAGVGSETQNRTAMGHVHNILKTDTGLRLIYPGFKTYPEVTDPFTGYNPGNGENGAIFCHANGWAVIAQALLGDGDKAWEYYTLLAPQKALERVGLETYRAEPYAWASNIVGPENPKHGWANVTHITGTAAWMDIAANQFLLGIRPKLTGVQIAPVMKSEWEEMSVQRTYRGTRICMTVRNPKHVSSGVAKLTVDGTEFAEAFLRADYLLGKERVQVEVTLG